MKRKCVLSNRPDRKRHTPHWTTGRQSQFAVSSTPHSHFPFDGLLETNCSPETQIVLKLKMLSGCLKKLAQRTLAGAPVVSIVLCRSIYPPVHWGGQENHFAPRPHRLNVIAPCRCIITCSDWQRCNLCGFPSFPVRLRTGSITFVWFYRFASPNGVATIFRQLFRRFVPQIAVELGRCEGAILITAERVNTKYYNNRYVTLKWLFHEGWIAVTCQDCWFVQNLQNFNSIDVSFSISPHPID